MTPEPEKLDPNTFADDLLKVLAVLQNQKQAGDAWQTAASLARILVSDYGVPLHWNSIQAMLRKNPKLVGRRKRNKTWQFTISTEGTKQLSSDPSPIVLVDPTKAMQSVSGLHSFLSSLTGTLSVCDPYIDTVTIEHLEACAPTVSIRLLSKNINSGGQVKRLISALRTQGRTIEVKQSVSHVLHDRYIIDNTKMLILGTSLNGFGKRQCFVIHAGSDIRRITLAEFDKEWRSATSFF